MHAHVGITTIILYHGTNNHFEEFTEEYFGRVSEGNQSSLLGIWTSLTPVFPMSFAEDVLVLETDSERLLQIPSDVFKYLSADFSVTLDQASDASYVHPSMKWRTSGYDLVAAIEPNGSVGDVIVLNPERPRSWSGSHRKM